ncbi:cytochrome P450 [Actinoplanes awajinensis]|uniref:Cytochrome n=1 Tax=Actinoplanes awajinensis subsp. mycoplanecinus TaxID=135947 RepID=A0A0X3VEB0_9ACTN|nr:cytochrome P450 [Actinoplanes awajinensis]KUL41656.1 cytochrome [Actinoplanes awajinensis subsp. mycoplanecinus]
MLQFPLVRHCPYAPPEEYGQLREKDPVTRIRLPDGRESWVVTRHEHVRQVLNDPSFSADRTHADFPNLAPAGQPLPRDDSAPSMLTMDPPEHGPARRAVLGEFTVRQIAALRPRMQQIVDERLDAMLAGPRPADLVEELSLPVPSMVICEMLGVPYTDHDFFQVNTAAMIKRETPQDERRAAFGRIRDYLDELIAGKEDAPPDDLLGRQIRKSRAGGDYDRRSLVSLGFLLLVAGHETTANMISLGTLALLGNPAQMDALRADPARTLGAVEEMLRYFTIVDTVVARLCVADTEVGGVTIRAGEGVLTLGQAANRDPEAFDEPDAFDIGRPARHHVAFGFGPHQCLGQNLARAELQIVFDTLLRRVPALRLATPVEELPFKSDAAIYGVYHMPVTW